MKGKRFCFLILALLFCCSTRAQELRVRNITMENGLASNTVRNIVQDRFGFIWFGSDNGLCRYDGKQIRRFSIPEMGFNQFISGLYAASDGLLVGTEKGAFYFDFQNETFQSIASNPPVVVYGFAEDKEGGIWMPAAKGQIVRYDPTKKTSQTYPTPYNAHASLQTFVDNNNQIWVFAHQGKQAISRLNKANGRFETVSFGDEYDNLGAWSMTQTSDGTLWIGTWTNGLLRVTDDMRLVQELSPATTGIGWHIHKLYEQAPNALLIGCEEGLICYHPQQRTWEKFMNRDERFVYSMLCDAEGGFWYGTFYGGVVYIPPTMSRFESWGSDSDRGHVTGRFCEDAQRRLWVATDDGGLGCYSLAENRFVPFAASQSLASQNIHALCVDGQQLWVGTYGNGVYRVNLQGGQLSRIADTDGQGGTSSYALFRDSGDTLWSGTIDAVCVWQPQLERFKLVQKTQAMVIDIDEDAQGNLWFSTQGAGLWRYARKSGKWFHYKNSADSLSIPSDQVNSVCVSSSKQVWVGTSRGLCRYDANADCFHRVPLRIPSEDISCVVEDQDVLWLSTTNGIVRYAVGEPLQVFNRYDGLVSSQFQPNAGLKTSDGKIFFGTAKGFNAFYPYQIKINQIAPRVFITGLEINNQHVEVGTDQLPEALEHTKQIDLSHRDNTLRLTFSSLSFCTPEKNQYAYMLEGFDREWNYVGDQNNATYTNLPSGTYTFRVKATNNDGVWSKQDAALRIVVHPPFWLTWPAKLFYLLLLVAAGWLYSQYRLRKAERRHAYEMQRLSDRNQAEEREQRLKFFTMVAHEIRTPVSLIIAPLENLMKKEQPSDDLKMIDRNAHRLLELVNQLLDFNKVQREGMQAKFALHNVSDIVRSVAERFVPTLQHKGATLEVHLPDNDLMAVVDEEGVTKIISNLMTNATKYTKDKVELTLASAADGQSFNVTVEDNGIGISRAEQQKIFQEFYQAKDNKPGTGIGLSIVKTIVALHRGQVSVDSQPQQGARFVVTLPMTQPDVAVETTDKKTAQKVASSDETQENAVAALKKEEANGQQPSVLIVEDDADMLSFLTENLKAFYNVYAASNGVEGLQQLAKRQFSLIVSDWMMPEMDGGEFCRRVRADRNTSHIPVIMLTAKTDNDTKALSMDLGADAFIEKPFSVKYLHSCIRNLIERRRQLMHEYASEPQESISNIATTQLDDEFLQRMKQIIEDNINSSDLSVNFLASQLNISRSGLFSKIKLLADVTPNEMIQIVRLKKAASLLKDPQLRINEVSYMVGFSSPSYFSKCFFQQFGMRPGDYQKQVNNKKKDEE